MEKQQAALMAKQIAIKNQIMQNISFATILSENEEIMKSKLPYTRLPFMEIIESKKREIEPGHRSPDLSNKAKLDYNHKHHRSDFLNSGKKSIVVSARADKKSVKKIPQNMRDSLNSGNFRLKPDRQEGWDTIEGKTIDEDDRSINEAPILTKDQSKTPDSPEPKDQKKHRNSIKGATATKTFAKINDSNSPKKNKMRNTIT